MTSRVQIPNWSPSSSPPNDLIVYVDEGLSISTGSLVYVICCWPEEVGHELRVAVEVILGVGADLGVECGVSQACSTDMIM